MRGMTRLKSNSFYGASFVSHRLSFERPISRRDAFQFGATSLLALGGIRHLSAQQVPAGQLNADADLKTALNRFPRMMQDAFAARLAEGETIGTNRRTAVHSKADAQKYVATVRSLIRECFGPFPERTPLKPRVTGVVEREAYRIEKIIFESRPDFLVTANLYVPKGRTFPLPSVVGSCGHSVNGKAAEAYQSFAQGLARQGYVVLIFDPIGQGERLQFADASLKSRVGAGVHEHLLAGNQQFLAGEFFGSWRAWDGIRALDYLLSRTEVDPQRVGITGNSGGGTMTMWLCGLEPRWTMAAPSCAVTTFRRNFSNELPTDTEQCPPLVLRHGLDHADFLAAMAPKPVIILAAEKDYFDVRGAIEAYERLQPIYRWLGAESNIRLFIGPNEHGYTQPNREAMYGFFNEQTGIAQGGMEPPLTIETDQTLQCTKTGQVSELGSKTVTSFTQTLSQQATKTRPRLNAAELRQKIVSLLPAVPEAPPDYEILRPVGNRRYAKPHATWYAIQTEALVRSVVTRIDDKPHYSRPRQGPGRVILYVAHHSSDLELRIEPLVKQLIIDEPQSEFMAVDLRGIGDSRPDACGEDQFLVPYGSDYFYAAHAIMLGQSIPALRAFDLLRVITWIKSQGRTEIHLVAVGWGTIPAILAAVTSNDVHQVTLKQAPASFASIAEADHYDWPLSSFVPGVLKEFDLPDCYQVLEAKGLNQIDPTGAHS